MGLQKSCTSMDDIFDNESYDNSIGTGFSPFFYK